MNKQTKLIVSIILILGLGACSCINSNQESNTTQESNITTQKQIKELLYEDYLGDETNKTKAIEEYIQKCEEEKDAKSCYKLGQIYYRVELNTTKAKIFFKKACDLKYPKGCRNYKFLNKMFY